MKRQKRKDKKSFIFYPFVLDLKRKPRKMKPSGWLISKRLRDCKKLRITIYELRFTRKQEKSKIVDPKSEIRESRSSVWLEHYTDNVGVSSSNLLGTTFWSRKRKAKSRKPIRRKVKAQSKKLHREREKEKSFRLSPLSFQLIYTGD